MPLYEYRCESCGRHTTAYRTIDQRNDAPECHGAMQKVITPTFVRVFSPYTTVAWDKEEGKPMRIRTQAEHNAFLNRNGFLEVGNDKSMAPPSPEEVAESHARQRAEESTFTWIDTDL